MAAIKKICIFVNKDLLALSMHFPSAEQYDVEKAAGAQKTSTTGQDGTQTDEVLDWEGPNDSACALNWPRSKKWTSLLLISVLTLLTPFASSMFAPSIDSVLTDLQSTNRNLGSSAVSVYL